MDNDSCVCGALCFIDIMASWPSSANLNEMNHNAPSVLALGDVCVVKTQTIRSGRFERAQVHLTVIFYQMKSP